MVWWLALLPQKEVGPYRRTPRTRHDCAGASMLRYSRSPHVHDRSTGAGRERRGMDRAEQGSVWQIEGSYSSFSIPVRYMSRRVNVIYFGEYDHFCFRVSFLSRTGYRFPQNTNGHGSATLCLTHKPQRHPSSTNSNKTRAAPRRTTRGTNH